MVGDGVCERRDEGVGARGNEAGGWSGWVWVGVDVVEGIGEREEVGFDV